MKLTAVSQPNPGGLSQCLPVGGVWRTGAPATSAVCEMVREEQAGNAARYDEHKMDRGNSHV
jgi:hypothetical protein